MSATNVNRDTLISKEEEYMIIADGQSVVKPSKFITPVLENYSQGGPPRIRQSNLEEVNFGGWYYPTSQWKLWVKSMLAEHLIVWQSAGILDAVKNSCYHIHKHDSILEIIDRWCQDTKSFLFSWGETTITLEDLSIIGGYSVTGECVVAHFEDQQFSQIVEDLETYRLELVRTRKKKPTHSSWIELFKDKNSPIEQEAFLSLWLSRFVFPSASDSITSTVFPLAVRLARGSRVALAPAILSGLYRDLGNMKNLNGQSSKVTVWSPFHLLLIWAWERFPLLRPSPISTEVGQPRLARWHKIKMSKDRENSRIAIESGYPKNFCWRPYASDENSFIAKDYYFVGGEQFCSTDFGQEIKWFIWCIRPSELLGLDGIIEQYLPHRVARQFGMDQDIPGVESRDNISRETAWKNYTRPITDILIVFPHLREGLVTAKYAQWWDLIVRSGGMYMY